MKLIFENEKEVREFYKLKGYNALQLQAFVDSNKGDYEDFSITMTLTMPEFFHLLIPIVYNYVQRYQSVNKLLNILYEKVFQNEKYLEI